MTRVVFLALMLCSGSSASAQGASGHRSITDTTIELPTFEQLLNVLLLRDYNTRVVVLGTAMLGLAAGTIGAFMLLRKRALMGDALSHATLPGIGLAFIVATAAGANAKSLPVLLSGAVVTGVLGVLCVLLIRHTTRLKEDAALGIVLSVFFGAGVAVLGIIQKMGTGSAAGLESFIYGKTASMLASDARLIGGAALVVAIVCAMLYKEFTLLCFDAAHARTEGWPIVLLDLTMMSLVVAVTVIGLQAVGLILIIALLIIPAAAARFWTDRLFRMLIASACIGAVSGLVGASLSALVPRLPAGAIIVVVSGVVFMFSMIFGPARGVLTRWLQHLRLTRKIARQHLLRAIFEWAEDTGNDPKQIGINPRQMRAERHWPRKGFLRAVRSAERDGLMYPTADGSYRLTETGWADAARMARNHRLWETYLIAHADVAPSHVDRDADMVEHVLGADMIAELEQLMADTKRAVDVPPSPHRTAS